MTKAVTSEGGKLPFETLISRLGDARGVLLDAQAFELDDAVVQAAAELMALSSGVRNHPTTPTSLREAAGYMLAAFEPWTGKTAKQELACDFLRTALLKPEKDGVIGEGLKEALEAALLDTPGLNELGAADRDPRYTWLEGYYDLGAVEAALDAARATTDGLTGPVLPPGQTCTECGAGEGEGHYSRCPRILPDPPPLAGKVAAEDIAWLRGHRDGNLHPSYPEIQARTDAHNARIDRILSALTEPAPAVDRSEAIKAEEARLREYLADYEFRGDNGDYTPNEQERTLIEDALRGWLAEEEQR